MIGSITKPKLAKGLSYVLKTSQLEKALIDAGIDCHLDLTYWIPQTGGSILEGHYWLPNENVPYPRVYVRAGVVSSKLRAAVARTLVSVALPAFVNWLRRIRELPADSPALQDTPYFNAAYSENGLVLIHQPAYKGPRKIR